MRLAPMWFLLLACPVLAHNGEDHSPKIETKQPSNERLIERDEGFDLMLDLNRFRLSVDTPFIQPSEDWKLLLTVRFE